MTDAFPILPLGEVASIKSGFAFRSSDMGNEGAPVIKIGNINPPSVDIVNVDRVPFDIVSQNERVQKYLLEEGDALVAMTGATVGKLGRFPKTDEPYYLNQRVGKLFLNEPQRADYDFLYYVLSQQKYIDQIFSSADGSAQANISGGLIESFEIPLPPLTKQKTIASVLGALDDKIENNRRMNETLEEMAQAIFQSWFIDFDPVRAKIEGRPTGLPDDISDLFPDALADSEIGEIPRGWSVFRVKEQAVRQKVGKLYSNKTVSKKGEIPVIDQSDDGVIGFHSNEEYVSASLENPVFTFANHTCKMRLLFENFGVIQNVIPIRSNNYPTIWFFLRTLGIKKLEEYKGHIPEFMETKLCFPDIPLASAFEEQIRPIFHRIHCAKKENQTLAELRDTLLPKLMSGEIDVSNLRT